MHIANRNAASLSAVTKRAATYTSTAICSGFLCRVGFGAGEM